MIKVPQDWIPYLIELFGRESSWNHNAKNPNSTAHGYAQFLNSTEKQYEKKFKGLHYENPVHALVMGIQYIKDRYGNPINALKHWDKYKWY